ncbi:MAG: HAD hydrolase-like protein, partial [Duodenibacillus sp.]|nr:HAD hydrolase-like protein [Duodenibacillus sp.]
MPLRAVFFDLDGTLVDTLPELAFAVNGMLAHYGRPPVPAERVAVFIGRGAPHLIRCALEERGLPSGDAEVAEGIRAYLECMGQVDVAKTVIFPGTVEALRALRGRGVKTVLVTNKMRVMTRKLFDATVLGGLFDGMVCGDDVAQPKPAA